MKKIIIMFAILFTFFLSFGVLDVYAPTIEDTTLSTQEVVEENYYEQNVYADSSSDDLIDKIIPDGTSIIVTLIVTGGVVILLIAKHNSANKRITASNYIDKDGYIVKNKNVKYIRQYDKVYRGVYKQNK